MAGRYEIMTINPYKDTRGELKKIFTKALLDSDREIEEIYVLYTKKGCIRGNHYHKKNLEFFSVMKGTATIVLKDLENGESELLIVSAEDDIVIKVPENVAHGFRNDEDEELVILAAATHQYCPEEADTYAFELI